MADLDQLLLAIDAIMTLFNDAIFIDTELHKTIHMHMQIHLRATILDHVKAFTCGNLFLKNNWTWEFIFKEKGLFKTSKSKNFENYPPAIQ